jgi:hypothetical protein
VTISTAIGRITVLSAQLELAANLLAWMLIYPHCGHGDHWFLDELEARQIGRRAFAGDSFASIITKVQRISEYVLRNSPKTHAEIQQWTIKARDLQERRNEIIHAGWSDLTGETVPIRLLGRGEPRVPRTPVTEFDKLADDIEAAIKEIASILQAISPRRHPP